jgi:NAD(P)-dependent dehydrogenase (short-subunit alcohol dehydrogenase family)
MPDRVVGKVAIVTGAAGLLGKAGACLLAREGAKVVFNDIDPRVETVVAEARAEGLDAVAHVGSNVVERDVAAMVDLAVRTYGRLDVLWNNAGPVSNDFVSRDSHVTDMSLEFFVETFRGHAGSVFLCSKHAIPAMIASGDGGSIINASSEQSYGGDLVLQAYGVAKSAINSLTQNIATAYGVDGIRCNAIGPGLVAGPSADVITAEGQKMILDSQMLPRPGEPRDIAGAVLFLASDEASWLTGQTIYVDGGLSGHQPHVATRRTLAGAGHQS